MNESEAPAELSRALGPRCADALRNVVSAIKSGRYRLERAHEYPDTDRRRLKRTADSAAEVAATLRQWLGDPVSSRRMVFGLVNWRSRHDAHVGTGDRVYLSDVRRELRDAATALEHVAQWASVGFKMMRETTAPGPKPDDKRELVLQVIALTLAEHGKPLASGDNSLLVRVARLCWPQLGFSDDPRDTLRRAIKRGSMSLDRLSRTAASISVREVGGGSERSSSRPAPGGEKPKPKARRAL